MSLRALVAWGGVAVLLAGCGALPPPPDLLDAVAELRSVKALAGGRVGVCVVDAGTGERLVGSDDDRGFATASNMKLVSAAVALHTLGPEHRFTTEVLARGALRDGVLHGDLVLRGGADPTLAHGEVGMANVARLVAALRERGVQRVTGRVLADDEWLGREHLGLGWQWDYLDEDYAAPFGALCWRHNVVTVRIRPDAVAPAVVAEPGWWPMQAEVRPATAGAATAVTVRRALGRDLAAVRGTIAADAKPATFEIPVPDPAAFAARGFTEALRAAGIEVGEDGVAGAAEAMSLARVESPPLREIVGELLRVSDNLYAEQVARASARAALGDGSTEAMAKHAKAVLAELGVDPTGAVLADGSGLSRRNLVQPRQLAGLLAAMHRSAVRAPFVAGLPVAGESGTLRNRFRTGSARGVVRAKTGFISRVVCLSGYVPHGESTWAFSVMLNDFTCSDDEAKAAVDAFVQRLCDLGPDAAAPPYRARDGVRT
ncbi:MAG: D-alanyl-D-alanine carboxypeptidase/D-alanyl-D-alanine-endopeptidase [Planctomycetes bacterium]|nr:D-alanyl-D-alanine carboxypeptidase/D-alanyl-D-alanine-endopeptidase [Planctomycetota bacterium]